MKGIGLSGHMHGATLIDTKDRVLRPCILWNDTRSHEEAAALDADPRFRALTGNIVFPGFTAPKLAWVKNNEPETFAKVAKVLLPKDYLRLWLTGEYLSDMSDSAGTSWLDTGKRAWSGELLEATGLTVEQMPASSKARIVPGRCVPSLPKNGALAPMWSLPVAPETMQPLPVAWVRLPKAGFRLAGHFGRAVCRQRFLSAEAGERRACLLPCAAQNLAPDGCHPVGNRCAQLAFNRDRQIAGDLTSELGDALKAPTGVTFLPYLSGERTPHNDAKIRGAFIGLGHESDRAVLTQAVLEGVTFAIRDSLEALKSAGTKISRVTAIGGGSRSRYWLSSIATALDMPVDIPADGDFGAAFGAARLGLIAATGADPLSVCTAPETAETVEPVKALTGAYEMAYGRYRALYPAIRSLAS